MIKLTFLYFQCSPRVQWNNICLWTGKSKCCNLSSILDKYISQREFLETERFACLYLECMVKSMSVKTRFNFHFVYAFIFLMHKVSFWYSSFPHSAQGLPMVHWVLKVSSGNKPKTSESNYASTSNIVGEN